MRSSLFFAVLLLLVACEKAQPPQNQMPLAGELYTGVKDQLDLSRLKTTTGKEGVLIYIAPLKNNPDRFYATSEKGDVLFARHLIDQDNATVEMQTANELVTIVITNGQKRISSREAVASHGGKGFCQRETGESFAACFKAETDEFCDSFISCIALATQPSVSIVIAIACSCHAVN